MGVDDTGAGAHGGKLMNATISPSPKNFEEWLKSAPIEELVQGLYERLQEAYAEIETLKMEIKNLKRGLISHKHATQTGESTLPMSAVVPISE